MIDLSRSAFVAFKTPVLMLRSSGTLPFISNSAAVYTIALDHSEEIKSYNARRKLLMHSGIVVQGEKVRARPHIGNSHQCPSFSVLLKQHRIARTGPTTKRSVHRARSSTCEPRAPTRNLLLKVSVLLVRTPSLLLPPPTRPRTLLSRLLLTTRGGIEMTIDPFVAVPCERGVYYGDGNTSAERTAGTTCTYAM